MVSKIAVVTGGGTGMGRELVLQLARSNCNVSMCDVIEENMDQTMVLKSTLFMAIEIFLLVQTLNLRLV